MDCRFQISNCRLKLGSSRSWCQGGWQLAIGNWQLTCCVVGYLIVSGCATPRRTFTPPVDPATLDDVAFLHYLAVVPVVSVDEGFRAVLMLDQEKVEAATFEDRMEILTQRGAIKPAWRLEADRTLDQGTLAFMLTAVCKTPRSVSESLAVPTGWGDRRYALKTCVSEGLLEYGLPHDPVTGGQLLSALTRSEAYVQTQTAGSGP